MYVVFNTKTFEIVQEFRTSEEAEKTKKFYVIEEIIENSWDIDPESTDMGSSFNRYPFLESRRLSHMFLDIPRYEINVLKNDLNVELIDKFLLIYKRDKNISEILTK